MSKVCMHFIVSGRVQGVFYRSQTRQLAKTLRLTGWVKNLPTGEVEVLACGEQTSIEKLHQWLWEGPRFASVAKVNDKEIPWEEHTDFIITY